MSGIVGTLVADLVSGRRGFFSATCSKAFLRKARGLTSNARLTRPWRRTGTWELPGARHRADDGAPVRPAVTADFEGGVYGADFLGDVRKFVKR